MPEQKLRANRDRRRSTLAAWHLAAGRLVSLGDNLEEEIRPLKNSRWAVAIDPKPYEWSAAFGRPYWDVYRVELATGTREKLLERLEFAPRLQASPSGRHFAYIKGANYWICEVASGQQRNLTGDLKTSFLDRDDDHPAPNKPPFGVAGWTKDDRSLIVYDQHDLWELFADGSSPRRLAAGSAEQVEHRYIRLDPQEESIDTAKPLYLHLYGRWTKQSGIARLQNGKTERLLWLDKQVGQLVKAKQAEVYAYTVQAFDDSPDYFAAGPGFKNSRQVSELNPWQSKYAWGRAELIEYRNSRGDRLQGALTYPAGYERGKQYPMIVHIYEKTSQNLHRYQPLSDRSPYNASVWSSLGYFVLQPDIVFRSRDPGRSVVECLNAAVKKALEKGDIDPKRTGLVGHSWGAYGTTFTVTQSDLFAAAVAGAPLTNLSGSYGEIFWNTGRPETDHVETGQERMEVPLYEDPQAYIRNSATFFAHQMKTPLLIAHGDKDGACDWRESIEFYNVARRAGKQVVLLVYPGENHSLENKPNQLDYQRRIREWFGHYLKGEPAADWIVRGTPYLERQKELKDTKPAAASAALP
jgi:dienelactone hydrolase